MLGSSRLTLFILRHGQACDDTNSDFNRPLTSKGQKQAFKKGNILKQKFSIIDTIFCSSSIRTRETLDYANLDTNKSSVLIQKEFYLCPPEVFLTHINQITHGNSALIIGHNPGLHQFAFDLLSLHSLHRSEQENALAKSFPTGALAEFNFTCSDWSEIDWHKGSLITYNK